MASVEIIVREDAKGKAKRDRKGGKVVRHLVFSDGLKQGQYKQDILDVVIEGLGLGGLE